MQIFATPDKKAFATVGEAVTHVSNVNDVVSANLKRRNGGYNLEAVLSSGKQERFVIETLELEIAQD